MNQTIHEARGVHANRWWRHRPTSRQPIKLDPPVNIGPKSKHLDVSFEAKKERLLAQAAGTKERELKIVL
jgi:hypothetical protein